VVAVTGPLVTPPELEPEPAELDEPDEPLEPPLEPDDAPLEPEEPEVVPAPEPLSEEVGVCDGEVLVGCEECEPEFPPEDPLLPPPVELGEPAMTASGPPATAIAPDSATVAFVSAALPPVGAAAIARPLLWWPACEPEAFLVLPPVVATVAPLPAGNAFPSDTASARCSGLETFTIGSSWNTCAETSTTKTAIAIPIKVTPERAPTR